MHGLTAPRLIASLLLALILACLSAPAAFAQQSQSTPPNQPASPDQTSGFAGVGVGIAFQETGQTTAARGVGFAFQNALPGAGQSVALRFGNTGGDALSITNARARQLADGSKLVEVLYDLNGAPAAGVDIFVVFSDNGGGTYTIAPIVGSLSGAVGAGIKNGGDRRILWTATQNLPAETFKTNFQARVIAGGLFYGVSNLFPIDLRSNSAVPIAAFSFTPTAPAIGQTVKFNDSSSGRPTAWAWDFDDDGRIDSNSQHPSYVFTRPGSYRVTLKVSNAYGSASLTQIVRVSANDGLPVVIGVVRSYPGFFLEGSNVDLRLDVSVDWQGAPGKVSFSVNGGAAVEERGTLAGVSHTFKIGRDIPARLSGTEIKITATNGAGRTGPQWPEKVYVFPFPNWLTVAYQHDPSSVKFTAGNGEVSASLHKDFPTPHLAQDGPIEIPDWVPYIGGRFGLLETFAQIEGNVSSTGTGSLRLSGQTGFTAGGKSISGTASGSGDFRLGPPNGLELTGASFNLGLTAEISKEIGIIDAVPPLQSLAGLKPFKWLNQRAKLTGTITPQLSFNASFTQQDGELRFRDGTGKLRVGLQAKLPFKPIDRIAAEASLGGDGSFTLGVPEPLLRELQIGFEASARITFDYRFNVGFGGLSTTIGDIKSYTKRYAARCVWPVTDGQLCRRSDDSTSFAENSFDLQADWLPVSLIQPDYKRFGAYSLFQPKPLLRIASAATPVSAQETTLVQNIFPGASPASAPAGNGQIVLWEQQDTSLPVLQSSDIAWSYNDGNGWSAPALIVHDTQTELSPLAGTDQNGKVVAAWLRIKDPAFATPVNTVADLPLFYNKLEVVSAVFDPLSRSWGPVRQLTDDAALDTNLRMSSDGAGRLMLTWLSNPQGEFISTASNPATIKYSFWDGANWSASAAAASGLVGVSSHAAAVKGANAFMIVPREPNPDAPSDGVLDLYRWNGAQWSAAASFAAGGVENRSPSVVYDAAGEGHVVWVRGDDLVHATLSHPTPEVIRTGSSNLGFYDAKLLINPQGNLTLVWQQVVGNGPANLFAVVYDAAAGTWSADRRLTESAAMAYDVAGYYDADGLLRGVYLSTEIRRTTTTVMFDGQPQTISNIPENGPTDLHVFEHSLIVDLAVSDKDLTLNLPSPQPGDEVTATLKVHNAGDFVVDGFTVNLYAGEPQVGGVLLGSANVVGPLPAGGEREVRFNFSYPAGGGNIVAVVDEDDFIPEFSDANNRATIYLANTAPHARIAASVTGGLVPLTVAFDASASFDTEGDALSFVWTFADGSQSVGGARVSHMFTRAGSYPVTVTVTDARGASGIAIATINVITSHPVTSVSAASYGTELAPEAIATVFGSNLADTTQAAFEIPLPTVLNNISVTIRDNTGTERLSSLFFISPTQINYQIPAGTKTGATTMRISNGEVVVATGIVQVAAVAPGLFTADASGRGLPAAVALRIKSDASQIYEPIGRFDPALNRFVPLPIDLGAETDLVFLLLYSTGVRGRSALSNVSVKIGGTPVQVDYAGAQGDFVGLDQINVRLARSLAGRGEVDVVLTADNAASNTVRINIK